MRHASWPKLCGRIHDEKIRPNWIVKGYITERHRCEKPLGHKKREHQCGNFRWKDEER